MKLLSLFDTHRFCMYTILCSFASALHFDQDTVPGCLRLERRSRPSVELVNFHLCISPSVCISTPPIGHVISMDPLDGSWMNKCFTNPPRRDEEAVRKGHLLQGQTENSVPHARFTFRRWALIHRRAP